MGMPAALSEGHTGEHGGEWRGFKAKYRQKAMVNYQRHTPQSCSLQTDTHNAHAYINKHTLGHRHEGFVSVCLISVDNQNSMTSLV